MMRLQDLKHYVIIKQEAATNAATLTSDLVDLKDADSALILVHATTSNNATNNPSVLKIQEADDTNATSFADITGFVGDTSFTIPSSPTATTTAPFAVFNVDCKGRKRYLRLLVSPVTTQTFSAVAILGRLQSAATSTTTQNAAVVVKG